MMTLEEAIEHCKEVAKESREAALSYARENAYETAISCKACGQEHEQFAEWLTELKQRREAENSEKPKSNGDKLRKRLYEMSDNDMQAEFADYICRKALDSGLCIKHNHCYECRIEWLKKEGVEDD